MHHIQQASDTEDGYAEQDGMDYDGWDQNKVNGVLLGELLLFYFEWVARNHVKKVPDSTLNKHYSWYVPVALTFTD